MARNAFLAYELHCVREKYSLDGPVFLGRFRWKWALRHAHTQLITTM
jgi:hypothetical protein